MNLKHKTLNFLSSKSRVFTTRLELLAALLSISGSSLSLQMETDLNGTITQLIKDSIVGDGLMDETVTVDLVSLPKAKLLALFKCFEQPVAAGCHCKYVLTVNVAHLQAYGDFAVNEETRIAKVLVNRVSQYGALTGQRIVRVLEEGVSTDHEIKEGYVL